MSTTHNTLQPDAFTAMDAVEIKVTIRPDQELRAERAVTDARAAHVIRHLVRPQKWRGRAQG